MPKLNAARKPCATITMTAPVIHDVQAGQTEKSKAHVSDTGISDEQIQITLAHGNPADMKKVPQAEDGHDGNPMPRPLRHQWKRDAQQTIEPEFFEDARMQHGGASGSRSVAHRCPGVKRPERDQNSETKHKQ